MAANFGLGFGCCASVKFYPDDAHIIARADFGGTNSGKIELKGKEIVAQIEKWPIDFH